MAKKIINTHEKKAAEKASTLTVWITIAIIVVAAGAALAAVIFLQSRTNQPGEKPKEITAKDTIKETLDTGKTPDEATLKEALTKSPSNEEKQQLLQLLAGDAQRRGDFKAAVSYLEQAHEAGVTVAVLVQNIGGLYLEKLNDKPQALKYFKKARLLAEQQKNEDPYSEQNIQYLDSKIKELEAQGVAPAQ
ncbi:MAG TPA: hypothetical protein VFZ58_03860 [Candidatus Saccharimonadales bacterium]